MSKTTSLQNNYNSPPSLGTESEGSTVSTTDDLPTRRKRIYKKAGKIDFTTEYKKEEKAFEVYIFRAYNLAPKRDVDEVNPYVKVCLLPGKKQKQKTRLLKATKEPFINENFIFTELTNEDIDKYHLNLIVKNHKIKREILGEVEVALKEIDLEKKENFDADLWKKRSEVCNNFFNIFYFRIQFLTVNKHKLLVKRKCHENNIEDIR